MLLICWKVTFSGGVKQEGETVLKSAEDQT